MRKFLGCLAISGVMILSSSVNSNPDWLENQAVYQELKGYMSHYNSVQEIRRSTGKLDKDKLCYYAARMIGAIDWLENDGYKKSEFKTVQEVLSHITIVVPKNCKPFILILEHAFNTIPYVTFLP